MKEPVGYVDERSESTELANGEQSDPRAAVAERPPNERTRSENVAQ
ncbi:hypothetical protein ABSL23_08235 [Halobacterium sp. NMX12-1]|uniref:Uncharacterized protein n=1 Tax=Halobacterium sp. NMX12-1 TaxID=3166650 RepID=A0AAU8CG53_9EURY